MASIAASAALPTMAQNSSVPSNAAMPSIDSLAPLVAADVAAQPGPGDAQTQLRVEKIDARFESVLGAQQPQVEKNRQTNE